MKRCPECHRISRDDDFCSHCGSAVYGNDDHSSNAAIDCSNYRGHSHEKQTFTSDSSYNDRDFTRTSTSTRNTNAKKGKGCVTWFIVLWLFFTLAPALIELISDIF